MTPRSAVTVAVPGLAVLRTYRREWLGSDLVAGLVVTTLLAIAVTLTHGSILHHKITLTTIPFTLIGLPLAIFLGFEVISKVPTMLHTPLMSGTNAIHGIVIVGAMIVAGSPHPDGLIRVIGFVAMILASANVVGGFVVTDRMLEMFKGGPGTGRAAKQPEVEAGAKQEELGA